MIDKNLENYKQQVDELSKTLESFFKKVKTLDDLKLLEEVFTIKKPEGWNDKRSSLRDKSILETYKRQLIIGELAYYKSGDTDLYKKKLKVIKHNPKYCIVEEIKSKQKWRLQYQLLELVKKDKQKHDEQIKSLESTYLMSRKLNGMLSNL